MKMTGGQAVIETLKVHKVETVFGIPGGHNLALYDALSRESTIRHVLGRHEQGLGFMADGYARASGRVGVALATSGPALANLAAAAGGATTDTSPILIIGSTVRTDLVGKAKGGLHDCGDSRALMGVVCRYSNRCMSGQQIPSRIGGLFKKLYTNRPGAAYCEIPCDVLNNNYDIEIRVPSTAERKKPDQNAIERAVRLLLEAKRPLIWSGTGAIVAEASEEIKQLAERLGAVLMPTTLGRGIVPADHPQVVINDGALVTELTDLCSEADVILAVGTMFKQEDTADWAVSFRGKLIHIDIDPAELGKSYAPEVGIAADAREALRAIIARLPDGKSATQDWIRSAQNADSARKNRRRQQSPQEIEALEILRNCMARDDILVCDRCNLGYWAYRMLPVYNPRTFMYPLGYGSLGGALPQAFGAKIAVPNTNVVCVIGDGGIQFTGTELAVAIQENIAVTVVLCNNRAYGAIMANQDRNFGGRRFASNLINPDFRLYAQSYGITHRTAESLDEFKKSLHAGLNSNELNIVELTVDLADP